MPLIYDVPAQEGSLRQGEILGDVWEHRVAHPATEITEHEPDVESVRHPLLVVLNQDCDLQWDFEARQATEQDDKSERPIVPYVLLCDLYDQEEIRNALPGSDVFKRVKRNQDKRYHFFPGAPIGAVESDDSLPDLFLDFKKVCSVATARLYEGLDAGTIHRVAIIPTFWVQELAHRLSGFHSRIAVPT